MANLFFKFVVGLILLSGYQLAMAQDLWSVYESAQRFNGNWSGQQYDYLANQKNEALAFGEMLPQVGLQGKVQYDHFDPENNNINAMNTNTKQFGLGLRQALFRADKWANYEKSKIASQINEIQLLQQHQQLTEQVIRAYLGVLRAQAMTDSLNAEYTALKAQDEMMQARLQQGVVARVDTEEAKARLESVRASMTSNEVAILNAKQQLMLLTGQPIDSINQLKLPFRANLLGAESRESWLAKAQNQNLELQLAQAQVALAKKQQDYLKANIYPKVDLVGNAGWQKTNNILQSPSNGRDYSIGIEVDFPLYTGGRTKLGLQQAALQSQAAMSRLVFAAQNTLSQTSQAYMNVLAQKRTIEARAVAAHANQQVAQASKTGYDLGMRSMVDNLLAQRQYYAAEQDLIQAYFDYLNAYVDLQKATGNLNADTVKVINTQLQ